MSLGQSKNCMDEVKEVETIAIGDRNQHHLISTVLKQGPESF